MIKDRNLSPDADAFKQVASLHFTGAASLVAESRAGLRCPWTGKIVSAHVYCAVLTDSDDSVRVDLQKNGVSMLSATVDPVATGTTTALTISAANAAVVAGDIITVVLTTGVGDAIAGSITLVVRPYLGAPERFAAKAAGISITP